MTLKIPSKYAGECVALLNEKIIASGPTELDAYQKARILYPHKIVSLLRVPRKRELVTFL